jgi:nucleotide-binding universal stress UspA family protein
MMERHLTTPRKIVVGLDGSSGSARALNWAIGVGRALDSEVVAVHVFQLVPAVPAAYGLAPIPYSDEWQQQLRQEFETEWCAPLKKAGVRYRTVFEMGSPAPTLIRVADQQQADLIVTGTRGLGGFKELMLGSVSHQLVLHASVPVVVIPAESVREKPAVHPQEATTTPGSVNGFAPFI